MATEVNIKLINKLSQGLAILTKKGDKLVSRLLPARGVLFIQEGEFSQDILDKSNRGYLVFETTTKEITAPATVFTPA